MSFPSPIQNTNTRNFPKHSQKHKIKGLWNQYRNSTEIFFFFFFFCYHRHSLSLAVCDFGSYFKSCKAQLENYLAILMETTWESTAYFCQQCFSKNIVPINSFVMILLMKHPAFNLTLRSQPTTNKMCHFTFKLHLKYNLKK